MRAIHAFFVFALIAITSGFTAAPASACLSYNRVAELKLVDDAIASKQTKADTKTKLVALRGDMTGTDGTAIENMQRYSKAATAALKMIGKERVRNNTVTRSGDQPLPRMAGFVGCG